MLYIRKLEISDDQDQTIFKIKNMDAEKGLRKALQLIDNVQGKKEVKGIFRRFLKDLDKEFKQYFDMG